jgi:hypothetical protein
MYCYGKCVKNVKHCYEKCVRNTKYCYGKRGKPLVCKENQYIEKRFEIITFILNLFDFNFDFKIHLKI